MPAPSNIAPVSGGDVVTDWDKWTFKWFGKNSPVIPLGCVVTAGVLGSGFYQFKKGNKKTSQLLMRARVAAQAVTICAMMFSLKVQDRQKALGLA
mmetsp:Transcript_48319/g.75457  ORF Transcript_48319/g.75457 Transcript_48319/m.75457 type:complete len:95 (-) Transcript_48319:185-469(-)|eukprot:CAMPEP_0184330394 /NCGR_PEP_ID=MMETSP1049-20130417/144664_1 /TAXON_ID=77928 /ORGANISM="Proteomonas sulcata, Strain CCMP704" /LENGTH=94 /DNA_ID=CAMNT_0026652835 /DNA_START=100 /DNA_END=384 /DNA_ORIENTATION=-